MDETLPNFRVPRCFQDWVIQKSKYKILKHNLLMLFWTTKIGQTLKKVHLINFGMLWGIIVILGTKGSIMGKHWFSVHFSLLGPTDPPQN